MQSVAPAQLAGAAAVVFWASRDDALATSVCVAGIVIMLILAEIVRGPPTAVAVGFAFAAWVGALVVAIVVDDGLDNGGTIAVVVVNGIAVAVALYRAARGQRYSQD